MLFDCHAIGNAEAVDTLVGARTVRNHGRDFPEDVEPVVVIGYGLGLSNDELRRFMGLSHPGTVRLAAIRPLLTPLSSVEQEALAALLHKLLSSMDATDAERCSLCRLCDNRVCSDCPIPADFRNDAELG